MKVASSIGKGDSESSPSSENEEDMDDNVPTRSKSNTGLPKRRLSIRTIKDQDFDTNKLEFVQKPQENEVVEAMSK